MLNKVCIIICLLIIYVKCGTERIKLSDVDTITLHYNQLTNARRVEPIPQLKCVGGNAGCTYAPTTVQCYNRGTNGVDTQWECKAELNTKVKFGTLKVSCEGYGSSDDAYILSGSCGLEYTLVHADDSVYARDKTTLVSWIFMILIITAFIGGAIYKTKNSTSFYAYNDLTTTNRSNYFFSNTRSPRTSSVRLATGFASTVKR